ncbi:glycyl-tRNA synthetase [Nematocida homosporus]|uniref:glycyl-tRNA synthetase n=1 Tax=Nematocida homosporus TaxID=1912981 RepID=UPI00221FBEFE|nr:glycyl-tRNA synthetase [Nematocida homosporus]KAI5185513.1 glycyl-tRNA synthetase [Nematocida homosporus]
MEEKRKKLEQTAKRRFFYIQSFEAYGGVSGFFDYGPHMCALQNNFLSIWRRFFVLEESMQEVDTAIITPFEVLKSSGHVDKFTDLMCSDAKTGDIYRADHLVKDWLEREAVTKPEEIKKEMYQTAAKIDSFGLEELQEIIEHYQIKSETGNDLTKVVHFNLMFNTVVGPGGKTQSFLRPETAQGQFLNFKRLLEANGDKMPFASAMVGKAFRNEISPRTGLFRVREFLMAEIEHFVHPQEKKHSKFAAEKETCIPLLYQRPGDSEQTLHSMKIGDAVAQGVVNNETLGYFIARVFQFLTKIGIPSKEIRMRQHLPTEMAHYATDCWDAEINSSFGWIECVGIADRACYDLSVHSKKTGDKLVARRALPAPITVEKLVPIVDKKKLGAKFRGKAPALIEQLTSMSQDELAKRAVNGTMEITYENEQLHISVEKQTEIQHVEEYTPNVIEPSFGIGRILYALLWHSFDLRDQDEQRAYFRFTPQMAPTKCMILPLQEDARFTMITSQLKANIIEQGVSCQSDESRNSIGRRYARADEIGVPFCVTIDFDTLNDQSVTIRERDSCAQIRVLIERVPRLLADLAAERVLFTQLANQ